MTTPTPTPRTIAVGFDRVLHRYSLGWADGTIYDPPVPGAIEGLRTLMKDAAVYVHTARSPHQVAAWLAGHGLNAIADSPATAREFWDNRGQLLVSRRKYPALAYLDGRAVRFTGWDTAAADIALVASALDPLTVLTSIEAAPRFVQAPGCPHCPDGHTPPDHGQPWAVRVTDDRDGDGQPLRLAVERVAGAHVAETDAQWLRDLIEKATA